jgi:hypothetical protein
MAHVRPILLAIALVSILWTVWDPTYASFRRAQIQGRDVRVQGKHSYIVSMHICNLRLALLTFIRFSSCFHGLRGWSLLLFSPCLIRDLTRTICIYYIIHRHLEVGFIFLYCLLLNYPSVLFLFACHKLELIHHSSCQDFLLLMCCTAVAATSVHSTTRYDYQQISTRTSLHTLTKHERTLVPSTTCY